MIALRSEFVPLMDAAPLIIALERNLATDVGLALTLAKEASWATLRDRLVVGHLDGAHLLAPLAVAMQLGLSGLPLPLRIAALLSINGNAVTLSVPLSASMPAPDAPLAQRAESLATLARERRKAGRPLTLATVFRFSCHSMLLRELLRLGGGSIEDVDLVVLPPSLMVEGLAKGVIDGFCVGSP